MTAILLRQSRRVLRSSCFDIRHRYPYATLAAFSESPAEGVATVGSKAGPSDFSKQLKSRPANLLPLNGGEPNSLRDPLEPTTVDLYLSSIRAAGLEPTLDDVERCRPHSYSHPESPHYTEDYNNLVDTLCRSFSKDQLRHFTQLYGLDAIWTRKSRRKVEYAQTIIEKQWNWPSLKELERQRRDRTEISTKSFNVTPSQLFLILGKDGADLLQLSMKFNAHISVTPNPLALRVEALQGPLKGLSERIASLKRAVIEETFELPTKRPIRGDLIQRISRLAGAYVENTGTKGKLRICAKDSNDLVNAKRLATRAACEDIMISSTTMCYVPINMSTSSAMSSVMFPRSYSLYPFLSPRPLPWTIGTSGYFRIRQVGEWLGAVASEDASKTGGLIEGQNSILATNEEYRNLKEVISTKDISFGKGHSGTVITATLGHLLLASSSAFDHATIVSPLPGRWPLSNALRWLKNGEANKIFVPSLSPSLHMSPPSQQKILHRLLYHAIPKSAQTARAEKGFKPSHKVVKLEVLLAGPALRSTSRPVEPKKATATAVIGNDIPPQTEGDMEFNGQNQGREGLADTVSSEGLRSNGDILGSEMDSGVDCQKTDALKLQYSCESGVEGALDLLMPDRPMDIRLTVFYYSVVAHERQPLELRTYLEELQAFLQFEDPEARQPLPPLTFTFDDETYVLQTSASVRQAQESISIPAVKGTNPMSPHETGVQTVSENILDLESNQKLSLCRVICGNHESQDRWDQFLSGCDRLTTMTYRPGSGQEYNSETENNN